MGNISSDASDNWHTGILALQVLRKHLREGGPTGTRRGIATGSLIRIEKVILSKMDIGEVHNLDQSFVHCSLTAKNALTQDFIIIEQSIGFRARQTSTLGCW